MKMGREAEDRLWRGTRKSFFEETQRCPEGWGPLAGDLERESGNASGTGIETKIGEQGGMRGVTAEEADGMRGLAGVTPWSCPEGVTPELQLAPDNL